MSCRALGRSNERAPNRRFFTYEHLSGPLRTVSQRFCRIADGVYEGGVQPLELASELRALARYLESLEATYPDEQLEAVKLVEALADQVRFRSAYRSADLRRLLIAKDAAVRSVLPPLPEVD